MERSSQKEKKKAEESCANSRLVRYFGEGCIDAITKPRRRTKWQINTTSIKVLEVEVSYIQYDIQQ